MGKSTSINGLRFEDVITKESRELKFEELLGLDPKCVDCKELLTLENWAKSRRKKGIHLCKECARKRSKEHYEKTNACIDEDQ